MRKNKHGSCPLVRFLIIIGQFSDNRPSPYHPNPRYPIEDVNLLFENFILILKDYKNHVLVFFTWIWSHLISRSLTFCQSLIDILNGAKSYHRIKDVYVLFKICIIKVKIFVWKCLPNLFISIFKGLCSTSKYLRLYSLDLLTTLLSFCFKN